jgi:hypothetical protein
MNEFDYLREMAAKKRDRAIAAAREEYNVAVARIKDLKRSLGGLSRKASRRTLRPVVESLESVLPRDRLFTVDEAYQLLNESDPKRYFHLPTVRQLFAVLNREGKVKRVRRAASLVYWAVAEYEEVESVYGARTLASIAEEVLREQGPMRAIEIVVYIQSRNYRTDTNPRVLTRSLSSTMSHFPETFKYGLDKRWSVV